MVEFPHIGEYFHLPTGHIPPGQLMNAETINGVENPFFGIAPGELKKLPEVNGLENPFFEGNPEHWEIPDLPEDS